MYQLLDSSISLPSKKPNSELLKQQNWYQYRFICNVLALICVWVFWNLGNEWCCITDETRAVDLTGLLAVSLILPEMLKLQIYPENEG